MIDYKRECYVRLYYWKIARAFFIFLSTVLFIVIASCLIMMLNCSGSFSFNFFVCLLSVVLVTLTLEKVDSCDIAVLNFSSLKKDDFSQDFTIKALKVYMETFPCKYDNVLALALVYYNKK